MYQIILANEEVVQVNIIANDKRRSLETPEN